VLGIGKALDRAGMADGVAFTLDTHGASDLVNIGKLRRQLEYDTVCLSVLQDSPTGIALF
jgi:hypothetical protein